MWYRIYFKHEETGEEAVREVEATGLIYRVCDNHGRVVFGDQYPPHDPFIPTYGGREPKAYN